MKEHIESKEDLRKRHRVGKPIAEVHPVGKGKVKIEPEMPSQKRIQHVIVNNGRAK